MTSILPSRELLNELKLAKSKNSLIFAITEDREGLSQLLKSNNFDVRSVDLRDDGNLLEMLVKWERTPDNAVYLIYGISSQFPSVLGYLNLHRDLFYQIKRPVLMTVSEYEIREIQKHAPDLYRYRSRTYNLNEKGMTGIEPTFSEPKSVYYKLPIFEEKIDVAAMRERIKLDEYLLGTVNDDYKKAELYMDLAISYFKLDDLDTGNDYSRKSMNIRERLKDEKGILINYRRLILVFLLKKQFRKVIELSSLLLKSDPTSASDYLFRGIAYLELGQFETALKCYDKAIELDPRNANIWLRKGLALGMLNRYEDALESFKKMIEFDPQNAIPWQGKGLVLNILNRYEDALESFKKAIKLDPQNAIVWQGKGYALSKLLRWEEAVDSFEKAVELDPQNAIVWQGKGYALSKLLRWEEAVDSFEKAVELDPQNAIPWQGKGLVLNILNRYEDALEAFEKTAELGMKSATLYITLACLYRKLGKEAESAEACKLARDLIERENEYTRACFEAVCGSADAALALLRTALEKKQQTADWARQDPDFEFIRDDPRFKALLDEFSEDGKEGPE